MAETECIFCRIAAGEMKTPTVWESEDAVAFRDIDPQAPDHVLVVPRRHVASVSDLSDDDAALAGRLLLAARDVAGQLGLADGYRIVVNTGENAGQTVGHLHLHILGGRALAWPPG